MPCSSRVGIAHHSHCGVRCTPYRLYDTTLFRAESRPESRRSRGICSNRPLDSARGDSMGGSLIPILFIGMGMVNAGDTIPNPFDFAQGSAVLEAATIAVRCAICCTHGLDRTMIHYHISAWAKKIICPPYECSASNGVTDIRRMGTLFAHTVNVTRFKPHRQETCPSYMLFLSLTKRLKAGIHFPILEIFTKFFISLRTIRTYRTNLVVLDG
jgi:hypothetical protein